MKTLGEMTPQERAALTQEELDAIMLKAGAGTAFQPGGGLHVTLDDLREFENLFAKPRGPKDPSPEGFLMHAKMYS
ncbi:MAG: hypothetical protein M3Q08_00180 [Pseudomonadota bacterium]|nr:hypothetical protein [Pseudomonadota bacterium]